MRASLAFLLVLWVTNAARADAVSPPPTSCPTGATGTTSHAGQWCRPADCTATADCERAIAIDSWSEPGKVDHGRYECAPAGLCVRTSQVPRGGDSMRGDMATKTEALSSCHSDTDCPPDVPCVTTPHCVPDPDWVSPASPRSPSFWRRAFYCDEQPGPPSHVGGLFFGLGGLGLAAVLVRRRRRG